jgi:hypothetical protein
MVAHYVAVEAWTRGLDCVVLERRHLEKMLGLERFKSVRIAWMQQDFEPWFPYQEPFFSTRARSSIGSIFLSRVPLEGVLPAGAMTVAQRVAGAGKAGIRIGVLFGNRNRSAPSESSIVSRLAVLAAGLEAP